MKHCPFKPLAGCILFFLLLVLVGCTDFPTTYDRIDDDRVRVLDFVYDPAEAAPGDTVSCTAYFAGIPVDTNDISWHVSWNMVANNYGAMTPLDIVPLNEKYSRFDHADGQTIIEFEFVVPNDVLDRTDLLADALKDLIPEEGKQQASGDELETSTGELLQLVGQMARKAPEWKQVLPQKQDSLMQHDPLYQTYASFPPSQLAAVVQLLTAPAEITAEIEGSNMVRSGFTVRYNSRFADLPGSRVFVNRNPVIESICVYVLNKPNMFNFDTINTTVDTIIRLDDTLDNGDPAPVETLTIDIGKSWFIVGFTDGFDSSLTIDAALKDTAAKVERHGAQWYLQLNEEEVEGVSHKKLPSIVNNGNLDAALWPPTSSKVTSMRIWLEAWDDMLNEYFRPKGSTLKEVRVAFKYTEEYLEAH